jgi:acyl carrier protein
MTSNSNNLDFNEMNDTEFVIHAIWCLILNQKSIPLDKRFFEIGGDSLEFTLLATTLQEEFGYPLRIGSLINHDTIENMAAHLLSSYPDAVIKSLEIRKKIENGQVCL